MIGARGGRRRARDPLFFAHRLRLRAHVPVGAAVDASHAARRLHSRAMLRFAIFGIDSGGAEPGRQPADPVPGRRSGSRSSTGRTPTRAGASTTRCSSRCATAASLFPFVGTFVYVIVRPPEYLDDVRERELEMQAAEARLHELDYHALPALRLRGREDFLRCPSCLRKLKDPCPTAASRSTRRGSSARTARPRCRRSAAARRAARRRPARTTQPTASAEHADDLRAAARPALQP